jgi:hypothetical protein
MILTKSDSEAKVIRTLGPYTVPHEVSKSLDFIIGGIGLPRVDNVRRTSISTHEYEQGNENWTKERKRHSCNSRYSFLVENSLKFLQKSSDRDTMCLRMHSVDTQETDKLLQSFSTISTVQKI